MNEVVRFLSISHLSRRWPRTFSEGEARRVAIGRALRFGLRFLLMDEPLSFLERVRRVEIIDRLRRSARAERRFDHGRSLAVRRIEGIKIIRLPPDDDSTLIGEFPETFDAVMAAHTAHSDPAERQRR